MGDFKVILNLYRDNIRIMKNKIHHPLQVVFLPERFDYVGENREQTLSMAAPLESTRMQGLRDLAKELRVWLSLGGYHEKVSLNMFFVLLVYNIMEVKSDGTFPVR